MREIKFRAYYIPEKSWVTWDNWSITSVYDKPLESTEDWKVMQYTGLKDKNGVEIYEGDIVQYRNWHKNPDGSTTLSKENEYMEKVVIEYRTKTPFVGYIIQDPLEVIGNIYENPELLSPAPERELRNKSSPRAA